MGGSGRPPSPPTLGAPPAEPWCPSMREFAFASHVEVGERRFRERAGLDFEDFAVGQLFKHRPGLTVSQQDNAEEALDTLNQAMLHYDARFAARTEWGRNLVVSTLTIQRLGEGQDLCPECFPLLRARASSFRVNSMLC